MKIPDWTHFRSADADPQGPCCMLEQAFPLNELPRNYIWTIGYLGEWQGAEGAEISAQVKSYSREFLRQRADLLKAKKEEAIKKENHYRALKAKRQAEAEAAESVFDKDALKRKIEASPLQMAKNLVKSAGQLATGGMTDPKERMEICNSCPFKGDDQRCGKCGCFLPAKTRVKKSTCPIGKW